MNVESTVPPDARLKIGTASRRKSPTSMWRAPANSSATSTPCMSALLKSKP